MKEKLLWADPEFIQRLKIIKAKREIAKRPIANLPALTKEMMNCKAFKVLEAELLKEIKELL